ncbi:MAG: hypothetical protein SYNGOMJ08_00143 [Candidatus Syntrophoarchaeum sp. GoM_oil]|nr:MAG: hypothetical protein SYNGOMJ08_00143 [Candidatus Syntrophoarchaeum sp. GoM_oil]
METNMVSPRDVLVNYVSEMVQLAYPPSLIGEKAAEFVEAFYDTELPEEY